MKPEKIVVGHLRVTPEEAYATSSNNQDPVFDLLARRHPLIVKTKNMGLRQV